uniref:Putative F-box/FBD/LRR-repeat protein n=1 Tax=Noccaea caerulescens TaxID=107243 RepID=A0A1J3JEU7_NOCCA
MLGRLLLILISSVHVTYAISMLLKQTSQRFVKKSCLRIGGEDKISALPDDLLVHILLLVSTEDAVRTMILSKRWRFVWTMVPKLGYREINDDTHKVITSGLFGRFLGPLFGKRDQQRSIWRFVDESLQLHKAPILELLAIELGPRCPVNVDVEKWIVNAVDRRVRELGLVLNWSSEPTSLSKRLYTCDTLVKLYLSYKIVVDVPSPVCLPSLKSLSLQFVVYKDEDSLVRLLSNCPVLTHLGVDRHHHDNLTNFTIKVPSLEYLLYDYVELGEVDNQVIGGSLVIDSPALKRISFRDFSEDSCSLEDRPRLEKASINVYHDLDDKFMRSLSSVMYLELGLSVATVAWCNAINYSQLIECKLTLLHDFDWLESLMMFLHKSPNLKVLFIDQTFIPLEEDFSLTWNKPCLVPRCLLTHLEVFEWEIYRGRSEEKKALRYIFSKSRCLKRAGISLESTCNPKDREMMVKEIESMFRVSKSSQLLFFTHLEYMTSEL